MKILQRSVTTFKDSQRLGRWDRVEFYLSDRERPPKTLSFHLCHMKTKQNTSGWRRLAVSKFDAKSSYLNEDFERPLTTMNDCPRLAVIPNDPDTPMTAKDHQRHPTTGNDYMETRLKRCGAYLTATFISKTGKTTVHLIILNEVRSAGWQNLRIN